MNESKESLRFEVKLSFIFIFILGSSSILSLNIRNWKNILLFKLIINVKAILW